MAVAVTGSYKMFRDPIGWGSTTNLITPRSHLGTAGNIDNIIAFGGACFNPSALPPSYPTGYNEVTNCTEEYNGTTWSAANNLITARGALSGFGTSNEAIAAGGNTCIEKDDASRFNFSGRSSCTEEWDGSSWSVGDNTISNFYNRGGTGTQNSGVITGGTENTTGTAKKEVEWYDGTSWSSRPILTFGTTEHSLVGTQGDSFNFGGACNLYYTPDNVIFKDIYQTYSFSEIGGIAWNTEIGLITKRKGLSGIGSQNSALAVGGYSFLRDPNIPQSDWYYNEGCTEEWNGISWSNINFYNIIPKFSSSYHSVIGDINGDTVSNATNLISVGGITTYPVSLQVEGINFTLHSGSIETGSIAQGLIEGGTSDEKTSFNPQITDSTASIYDTTYARDINTVSDVSESLQWRNYPVQEQCIVSASFDEIFFPQNDSGDSEITIATYFLNPCATGSVQANIIYGEINSPESDDFIVIPWGTSSAAFGISAYTASNNTTFIGWSTVKPVTIFGGLFPVYNLLSTSQNVDIEPQEENQTYYAIFDCDVEEKVYCYTTSSNKNDICLECQEEKTIFFNKTKYQTSGSEEITWYEDIDLTTTASAGYYYLSGSENPIVYDLTTGSAIFEIICEGGVIYCQYPPGYFPTPTPTATPTLTPTLTVTPTLTPTPTV